MSFIGKKFVLLHGGDPLSVGGNDHTSQLLEQLEYCPLTRRRCIALNLLHNRTKLAPIRGAGILAPKKYYAQFGATGGLLYLARYPRGTFRVSELIADTIVS